MRILCEFGSCGPYYVRLGWANVFRCLGHEFVFWDRNKEEVLDKFNLIEPEIFFGSTSNLNRALIKAIKARPNLKVGLFGSAFGNLFGYEKDEKFWQQYPIDRASEKEIRLVEQLRLETGKPDFIFIHCVPSTANEVLGYWTDKLGIPAVSIMNAADTFIYGLGEQKEMYSCDASFIGGFWEYKARNLRPTIFPLCHTNLKVKIFSRSNWPFLAQHVGDIPDQEVKHLFRSSVVSVNVSEPHSTCPELLGYDIVERVPKVFSSGGCLVSDNVKGLDEFFSPGFVKIYNNADELIDWIRYFKKNSVEREEYISEGRRQVLQKHTYWDRVVQFLEMFNMKDEALRCVQLKEKYINKL